MDRTPPSFARFLPAVNQDFQLVTTDVHVILGNDALMKCTIPSFVSDFVEIVSWIDSEGGEFHHASTAAGKWTILSLNKEPSNKIGLRQMFLYRANEVGEQINDRCTESEVSSND